MRQRRLSALVVALVGGIGSVLLLAPQPAAAVVYCKAVGVPKGCVARPAAPVARCTRPGYPAGCGAGVGAPGVGVTRGVGVGAPGVGVAPANRGGPVNRIGVR